MCFLNTIKLKGNCLIPLAESEIRSYVVENVPYGMDLEGSFTYVLRRAHW